MNGLELTVLCAGGLLFLAGIGFLIASFFVSPYHLFDSKTCRKLGVLGIFCVLLVGLVYFRYAGKTSWTAEEKESLLAQIESGEAYDADGMYTMEFYMDVLEYNESVDEVTDRIILETDKMKYE